MEPQNELEHLLAAPKLGPQHLPGLFRLLRESTLVFLIPHHPEMEGMMQIGAGDELPPFAVWDNPEHGLAVPIFSSVMRAEEACRKLGEDHYCVCEMKGKELFHLLSCQEEGIAVNPATSLKPIFLDLEGVKQVAHPPCWDGASDASSERFTVEFVTAADYPTDLVTAVFQLFRGRSEVRAAWLARRPDRTGSGVCYVIAMFASGDEAALERDVLIVAGSAIPKEDACHVSFLDSNDPQVREVTSRFTPFYAAPDFAATSPLGEGGEGA